MRGLPGLHLTRLARLVLPPLHRLRQVQLGRCCCRRLDLLTESRAIMIYFFPWRFRHDWLYYLSIALITRREVVVRLDSSHSGQLLLPDSMLILTHALVDESYRQPIAPG